jgi:hypothetical protein
MGAKEEGASGIAVDWVLKDKDGNIKDRGEIKEERLNGDISK